MRVAVKCKLFLLIVVALEGGRASPSLADLPAALRAFEEARKNIVSGRIEWAVWPEGDPQKALAYVSRMARNGDVIFEIRGDREGWTLSDPSTGKGVSKYPQLFLKNEDGYWYHQETGLGCHWYPKGHSAFWPRSFMRDVRLAGTYISSCTLEWGKGFEYVWNNPHLRWQSWREEKLPGGNILVVGEAADGIRMTWEINPDKGWNAERITFDNEVTRREMICRLKQYGDVWFPARCDYIQDGKLLESIVVKQAALNLPGDAARFTPGDLGLEPGTSITSQSPGDTESRFWNGEYVCSREEWYRDVKSGKRQPGPTFRRLQKGEMYRSPYDTPEQIQERRALSETVPLKKMLIDTVGLWEAYVIRFIEKYQLNAEQRQQAYKILKHCQERAQKVLNRHHDEIKKLIEQLEVAAKAGDQERLEKLKARRKRFQAAIDRVFKEELCPRLDKIPTRAQRQAAEQAEAGKP